MTQAQQTPSAAAGEADDSVYTVVINDEEQYSIWPTFRAVPAGWREVGVSGPKAACLVTWTRPPRRRAHRNWASPDKSRATPLPQEEFA